MKKLTVLWVLVLSVVLMSACSKKGDSPTALSTSIGVAACDEYLSKYEACVQSKIPDSMKATLSASLEQTKTQWKAAAASAEANPALEASCKAALDAAKQSMQAYGCAW